MIRSADDVTPAVLTVMAQTYDERLRAIMVSLVGHLHGFIREVGLTEKEFREATAIINELGQRSGDSHNETVLMAGSLGVSALICLLNNGNNGQTETTQNLLGPFWRLNSPPTANGESIVRSDTPGLPLIVHGQVIDQLGHGVAGAEVDIWHASPAGMYENQDPDQAEMNLRGKFMTDENGRFWFSTVKMIGYPIPTEGVVGRLLAAQGRHPMRPAHLHALISKPGFKVSIAQVYDPADPNLETDVQFGVTRATTGDYVHHDAPNPDRPDVACPWYSLDYTFILEPGDMVLPRAPIR